MTPRLLSQPEEASGAPAQLELKLQMGPTLLG